MYEISDTTFYLLAHRSPRSAYEDILFSECSSARNIYFILNNTCGFNLPVLYCTLLNCGSFLHVHIVSLLVCNSCVAPTFSFEWNNEVRDLNLIYLI